MRNKKNNKGKRFARGGWMKKSKNKKVQNAQPNSYNGINFKSKLETNCYKAIESVGIPLEYEKETFTLLEGFEYNNEKFRPITYTPDFINDEHKIIIETKGYATDIFKLRWKLFKWYLMKNGSDYTAIQLKNKKEIDELINTILYAQ